MDFRRFYRTQRELGTAINEIIDAYWAEQLNDQQLSEKVKSIYKWNQEKLMKEQDFTTVIRQMCGKRRLKIVKDVLNNTEKA
ncbi:glycosyl transferase [Bacillus mycoides]|uniref:TIGR04540 family protein n=1 Tax=Bacillus mycoides TaxID=1405 RepID=UPI0018CF2260|nr:TIGR04540 family protein [Bacillus mycoides]MBG9596522.1 glycosyl transferase [Bacillus mycoides]